MSMNFPHFILNKVLENNFQSFCALIVFLFAKIVGWMYEILHILAIFYQICNVLAKSIRKLFPVVLCSMIWCLIKVVVCINSKIINIILIKYVYLHLLAKDTFNIIIYIFSKIDRGMIPWISRISELISINIHLLHD